MMIDRTCEWWHYLLLAVSIVMIIIPIVTLCSCLGSLFRTEEAQNLLEKEARVEVMQRMRQKKLYEERLYKDQVMASKYSKNGRGYSLQGIV